jgi:hypothetical protein
MPTKKILIFGTRLTYKIITPDIKRKQNKFFLEFLKYWPSSRDFNKLVIKAKMHANTYFLKFSLLLRDLVVCMKTKYIFFMSRRKRGILISDLYLYSIKIQTDIDQNTVKTLQKITDFFEILFEILLPKYYLLKVFLT